MGPKCLKVATRNKLDPNRRTSAPCPKDLIRSPLPMASSSPSIGWQMKMDSRLLVTISQPHHPCPNTSSRCSQTWKRPEFCKQYIQTTSFSLSFNRMYINVIMFSQYFLTRSFISVSWPNNIKGRKYNCFCRLTESAFTYPNLSVNGNINTISLQFHYIHLNKFKKKITTFGLSEW